jgi:hypothetical protein
MVGKIEAMLAPRMIVPAQSANCEPGIDNIRPSPTADPAKSVKRIFCGEVLVEIHTPTSLKSV